MSVRNLLFLCVLFAFLGCNRDRPAVEVGAKKHPDDGGNPPGAGNGESKVIGVRFYTPFSDADLQDELKELLALTKLTQLNLNETKVTNAGMKEVKELKGLRKLSLRGTEIGNAGLLELKHLEYLAELDLGRCRNVNDVCVDALKEFKQLTELNIKGAGISAAGFAELRKAHPTCKIIR